MNQYFDYIKTDKGFWCVFAGQNELTKISWSATKPSESLERNNVTDLCIRQLKGYFDGIIKKFELPLLMDNYSPFQKEVWQELKKIPYGSTISYKQLAKRLGNPLCIRAAASANGKNPFPIVVPCHRVIGTDGSMTGYAFGTDLKEFLLDLENAFPSKQMTLFN